MVTKEQAKKEIKKLIQKSKDYREHLTNEDQTCTHLILPFFNKVLGWDTNNPSEFYCQQPEGGKRMDYVVFLGGISQFIIEAKALNKEIVDVVSYYKQTKDYARQKDKLFAILTNFRHFIILRDVEVDNPLKAQINETIDIENISEEQFELLWSFSKPVWSEIREQGMALKYMAKDRRRKKIDEELLEYMKKWRLSLLNNLKKFPKKNKFDFKNEREVNYVEQEIQRFIDRLVFICYCEDKEVYEKKLKPLIVEKTERYSGKSFLLKRVYELFREYNNKFDSDLFDSEGYCDKFYFEDAPILSMLKDLRESTSKRLAYDFSVIEVDVLGKAYENFIGHLIKQKWRKFREEKNRIKRKSEGIYYTPQYIVNYIVENTVRTHIKNKSFEEIKSVKVLDPACGSGSFLLRAFDVLVEEFSKKLNKPLKYEEKQELFLNCIFGVDKDERACDIAKLRHSLKLAEREKKLPELYKNIRCGDSLIDDEKVIGYKAFDWKTEFRGMINNGRFDVVIGNPPYVQLSMERNISSNLKQYLLEKYESSMGRLNTFGFFIRLGIDLLKNKGLFSYIIPNTLLTMEYYEELREYILNTCRIVSVVSFESMPFKDAVVENIIIVLEKNNSLEERDNTLVKVIDYKNDFKLIREIKQEYFIDSYKKTFNLKLDSQQVRFREKMKRNATQLSKLVNVNQAIALKHDRAKYIFKEKKNASYKPLLDGRDIGRYFINFPGNYLKYDRNVIHSCKREDIFLAKEKLLFRRVGEGLIVAYDNRQYYALNTLVVITPKTDEFGLKFLLGLLNSRLLNYYYQTFLKSTKRVFSEIQARQLGRTPIKKVSLEEQRIIIQLVDKLISLSTHLNKIGDRRTDEKIKIRKDIKKMDEKINELVYKLYGITDKEKEIIEKSLK